MSQLRYGRKTQQELEQELRAHGPDLAQRLRRAKDYHEAAKHHAIWANPTFAEALKPGPPGWNARREHPLTMRFRLDERLCKPPFDYGSVFFVPPPLDPFVRRAETNGIFHRSPGGGLRLTLGEMTRIGRMYGDDEWVQRLCLEPPITAAHGIGMGGETMPHSLEDLIAWLTRNARSGWPDYVAACFDMYFAGVGVRLGVLPGRTPAMNARLAEAERVREEALRRNRAFSSQEAANRREAARRVADDRLMEEQKRSLEDPLTAWREEDRRELLSGTIQPEAMDGRKFRRLAPGTVEELREARAIQTEIRMRKTAQGFEDTTEQLEAIDKMLRHRRGTRLPARPLRPIRGR